MTASARPPRPGGVVPVPAALFGPLLTGLADVQSLRCALRALFLLHRRGGRLPCLTATELAADPVLRLPGGADEAERALSTLADHGVLLRASAGAYCADTPANRRTLAAGAVVAPPTRAGVIANADADAGGDGIVAPPRPNVYQLYEDNVGVITPMAAERLRDMEAEFPAVWVEDAFRQAVLGNARNLRYIEATLERWRDHGRGDGTPGGRPGTVRASEIFRRSGP